eukprot:g95.t1
MGLTVTCESSFSHAQAIGIQTVYGIGAPLSIIGSGFIVLSFAVFPVLRKRNALPFFCLSFADFFKSIIYMVNAITNPADECVTSQWCACSGGLRNFFGLATFLFIAIIATVGYLSTKEWGRNLLKSNRWIVGSQIFGWGFPLLSLIIIYTVDDDVIGDVGGKCWITKSYKTLRWLLYYLPLLLSFIYVCSISFATNAAIKTLGMSEDVRRLIRDRLLMYCVIFIFIRFWSLLEMIVSTINDNDKIYTLVILHSIFSPLQGIANAYVYGMRNHDVRSCWTRWYYEAASGNEMKAIPLDTTDGEVGNKEAGI